MAKNDVPPAKDDLDQELENYLKDLSKQTSSPALPVARVSGRMFRQRTEESVSEKPKPHVVIPTPRVSQEIESVSYFAYEQIIKSISPHRSHGLETVRGQTGDKTLIVQMAIQFETEYGEEAGKLLTSLECFYEEGGRLVPEGLSLIIELLKAELLDKISLRDRPKAIGLLMKIKPADLNWLEYNQLLATFVQWIRLSRPILVDMFLEKAFADPNYSEEDLEQLSVSELDEIRRIELIELLKKFNDVIQKFGYEFGNNFQRIYFDKGHDEAEEYWQFLHKL